MTKSRLNVLYEDNHLLAVAKPAGIATVGVSDNVPSLFLLAKDYIKRRYGKPGNVYLGVMSRLDAPVTGVVLFARTSKAAARLTEQFRTHAVEKIYWAVVEGRLEPPAGSFANYLGKDEPRRRMQIVRSGAPGAKLAKLSYRKLSDIKGRAPTGTTQSVVGWSLVEIVLNTGRKHQIRLQFAHYGHPVLGDRKYGAGQNFPLGIALHARAWQSCIRLKGSV